MQQKTRLAHGVEKTQFESEYDEKAKDLLSDKQVLAWIAKYTTLEFRDKNYSKCRGTKAVLFKISF